MRVKFYYLALSLCCMLPFMVQGADLDPVREPDPPRAPLRSIPISPITVETESGMLTLHFRSDLGEVSVLLQEVSGIVVYSELIDTSIQNQIVLIAPAGTYMLTITDVAGNVIKQNSVVIP